ncbi:hypothetical protein CAI21_01730 [Alkalilimnicola ehrlichii]|uniref:Enoyl reductase (ER) domain-containing protein n=1 Tax=Alkalilimnicola ehrlichii TaxID=351052 RepID=A0A3E0X3D9_9GAMM|nr:NAD(P)H-quinone oxidoreductase [Alkalilimnicola ehrlichii]RFA31366.1 hypothetical protein CAI21_01730 [Alkalilimnicola ehrlichii]RFA39360.1 hypothetical protein CAL65_00675 [Alkalilimnicola ehrlichii]
MRAWLIETNSDGFNALRLGDAERPIPGPSELLIRVAAVGINRADLLQVKGLYPPPPGTNPKIPGLEYAGVVEAVGSGVQHRRVGDRVMGLVPGAAYAEYVTVQEREAIPVPEGMALTSAAAIPEAFMTAYRAIFIEGDLKPGQACLIQPVSSGVGLAGAQLVHALGGTAIGSSRSEEKLAQAQGLAAGIVDGRDDFVEAVKQATGGEGVAVVFDMLGGGGRMNQTLECVRNDGRVIIIGLMSGREDQVDFGHVLRRRLTLRAFTMRSQPLEERIRIAQRFIDELLPLFERGRLRPDIAAVHPFSDAPGAHAVMASNSHCGKLILDISQ